MLRSALSFGLESHLFSSLAQQMKETSPTVGKCPTEFLNDRSEWHETIYTLEWHNHDDSIMNEVQWKVVSFLPGTLVVVIMKTFWLNTVDINNTLILRRIGIVWAGSTMEKKII